MEDSAVKVTPSEAGNAAMLYKGSLYPKEAEQAP